ncbi:unnamed protein product [Dracunculus medinensis]|uniref:MFS domain-containing protein n=1 Tax=Dracunculus medinensis TaxID=318479 RepID=A0A158Q435_DRAME|nr:unnamed protein product [Dracunculus medinensis]
MSPLLIRFTVAAVLTQIQDYFQIGDSNAGLLQTIFIVFYMIFAPLFGYFGDRYNRKMLMIIGLTIWTTAVFTSSLIHQKQFWLFVLCRGIVGIGEASYSTIAPTIIADLFIGHRRSTALMVFYFAIPVGSGLGFIMGSNISLWTGSWQWGIRLTPIIGIICLLLLIIILNEPIRGAAENANLEATTLCDDIKYLLTIRTYIFSTIGSTCVVSVAGCLAWWTPTLIQHAWSMEHGTSEISSDIKANISLTFGFITCVAGIIGVIVGSALSQVWQEGISCLKPNKLADPHVCAIGAFMGVPLLFFALTFAAHHIFFCWVFIFCGVMCCSFNWAVNMDILMYITVAHRRAVATAMQTLICHLFGDASTPYIVGLVSDTLRGDDSSIAAHFYALQRALYIPNFILVGGGAMYLICSLYLLRDKEKAMESVQST